MKGDAEMNFKSYGLLSWICAKTFFMYDSLQLIESNALGTDGKQYDIVEDENTGLLYYTKL